MADRYALALVTPPVGEPIEITDVKAYLRVDRADDDVQITDMIRSARRHFDGPDAWFGRALLTQTWELYLDRFPTAASRPWETMPDIVVPLPPLQSVASITYIDAGGVLQTLADTDYVVDIKSDPGRIVPAYGLSWPLTRESTPNAVTVKFVAGYGTALAVPEDIKAWLRSAVAYLYARREAAELPSAFFWSLARYKRSWGG